MSDPAGTRFLHNVFYRSTVDINILFLYQTPRDFMRRRIFAQEAHRAKRHVKPRCFIYAPAHKTTSTRILSSPNPHRCVTRPTAEKREILSGIRCFMRRRIFMGVRPRSGVPAENNALERSCQKWGRRPTGETKPLGQRAIAKSIRHQSSAHNLASGHVREYAPAHIRSAGVRLAAGYRRDRAPYEPAHKNNQAARPPPRSSRLQKESANVAPQGLVSDCTKSKKGTRQLLGRRFVLYAPAHKRTTATPRNCAVRDAPDCHFTPCLYEKQVEGKFSNVLTAGHRALMRRRIIYAASSWIHILCANERQAEDGSDHKIGIKIVAYPWKRATAKKVYQALQ